MRQGVLFFSFTLFIKSSCEVIVASILLCNGGDARKELLGEVWLVFWSSFCVFWGWVSVEFLGLNWLKSCKMPFSGEFFCGLWFAVELFAELFKASAIIFKTPKLSIFFSLRATKMPKKLGKTIAKKTVIVYNKYLYKYLYSAKYKKLPKFTGVFMKKLLTRLLVCVMALVMVMGIVGCGESEWDGTSMKKWGAKISNGGFIAETENYLYFINGTTSNGDDNEFGVPVKGALMAVEKSSIGTANVKTQVVVPKLFVASDYNAGVYIYGDYVYYGSPSTDKDNDGNIAIGDLTFARTKLDGTDTKEFFTVSSLSASYRIAEKDGVVYIVYYDMASSSLKSYNTKSGSSIVIAKTDYETKDKYESLKNYAFLDGEGVNGLTVIYEATVYQENYYEEAVDDDYARTEETFNKLYAYTVGDKIEEGNEFYGKCILDGGKDNDEDDKVDELVYEISLVDGGYLFYKQTDLDSKETVYAVEVDGFDFSKKVEIKNADFLSSSILIKSLEEIYTLVDIPVDNGGEEGATPLYAFLVKTSLIDDTLTKYERVAKIGSGSDMLEIKVHNGKQYLYFVNPSSQLARVELSVGAVEKFNDSQRISEKTVGSSWYAPEFIDITTTTGEGAQAVSTTKTYAIYLDNSSEGASYVKMVEIYNSAFVNNAEYDLNTGIKVASDDVDDDGKADVYYLEGHSLLGKMIEKDLVNIAVSKLESLTDTIKWEVKDGVLVVGEKVVEARNAYDKLSEQGKKDYGEDNLTILESAEKAVEAIKVLYKLDGIVNYEFMSEAEQAEFKTAYEQAKVVMDTIDEIEDQDILNFIDGNLLWSYYEKATDLFAK